MLHNEISTVCAFICVVFSTLLPASSSETINCTKAHVKLPWRKAAINDLEILISFDSQKMDLMYPTESDFIDFVIKNPGVHVKGNVQTRKLGNDSLDFDSQWSDDTSQFEHATIKGRVGYEVSTDSPISLKYCGASLTDENDFSKEFNVSTARLLEENGEDGKLLVKLQKPILKEIWKCLSSELCDRVKPIIEKSFETNHEGGITEEPPQEEVETVDMDRAVESIVDGLNKRENFENWDTANVSVPQFGNQFVNCSNGGLRDVEDLRVHDEAKATASNGGIRVRVPLELPTAFAIYDCKYNSLIKNQYPSRVVVNAEKLKFKLDLFVEKMGGECKSTVTELITSYPGEVENVNDYNSGEPVTYPLQRLAKDTWETEVIFALENQIRKVAEQRLHKIDC